VASREWRDAGGDAAQRPRTHFRLGPAFDRSQVTELPPPAEPMPLDPPTHEVSGDELSWALEPLIELVRELGYSVAYEPMPADHGGYYRPRTGPSGPTWQRTIVHRRSVAGDRTLCGRKRARVALSRPGETALKRPEKADEPWSCDLAADGLLAESQQFPGRSSMARPGLEPGTPGFSVVRLRPSNRGESPAIPLVLAVASRRKDSRKVRVFGPSLGDESRRVSQSLSGRRWCSAARLHCMRACR
jgi:hypothetical protein